MKSLKESILKKTDVGLVNLSPEKFAEVYFKSKSCFVLDDRLYISSTPLRQLVIDDDFPDIKKFKISKLGSGFSSHFLKITIKNWEVFKKHFFDLGRSDYGRCEIQATVTIDDPNADITDFELDAYDFKGKLIFKRAKSVVFSYQNCFDRAEDYVFYKTGIGRLSLPFGHNSVNSIEFRK